MSLPSELTALTDAAACLAFANTAQDAAVVTAALERAASLDRDCQPALINLAAAALEQGDGLTTLAYIEEAARVGPLPPEVTPLREQLFAEASVIQTPISDYLGIIGRLPVEPAERPLTIVLVTNLFPPQELGGYGRMMWEFAHGLRARGHTVRVLTADVPQFAKPATEDEVAMEEHVMRTLALLGSWEGGRAVPITDRSEQIRRLRDNAARVRTAVTKLDADLVLAGNIDFLGVSILEPALSREVPVLHALANAAPGYPVNEQPLQSHYWVAPCSDWNGTVFRQAGFAPTRVDTLYPGARVDRFFRLLLPETGRIRLCYASLVLPYKGAHTLVNALIALHRAGVDFTAEIAGDAPDAAFLGKLRDTVRENGLDAKVSFTGFLNRDGLKSLFARSNLLVFPSEFDEPFGISQVEAMAAGLVVVSSGTGGAREIVRDGVDGLLFRAGNATDLTDKLVRIARDPQLFTSLQRASQARALTFSVNHAVRKIETLAGEMHAAIEASKLPFESIPAA
jgi:glycosyltransferase involved in cell wall biosynthesis